MLEQDHQNHGHHDQPPPIPTLNREWAEQVERTAAIRSAKIGIALIAAALTALYLTYRWLSSMVREILPTASSGSIHPIALIAVLLVFVFIAYQIVRRY